MPASKIPLGSVWFWLMWKLLTFLSLIIVPAIALRSSKPVAPDAYLALAAYFFLLILLNDMRAYGYAREDGICYRRYFQVQFLRWNDIGKIHWSSPNRITLMLRSGVPFRKTVLMQSFDFKFSIGSVAKAPEVVRWLLSVKPEGAEGILLEGPGL
jgi:hypothetical protein